MSVESPIETIPLCFLGLVLGVKSLFHPLRDHELYRDKYFWHLPDHADNEDGKDLTVTFTDITAA